MASILDRFKTLITKQAQNTNVNYNKALYNWLGNSIIWNQEMTTLTLKRVIKKTQRFTPLLT